MLKDALINARADVCREPGARSQPLPAASRQANVSELDSDFAAATDAARRLGPRPDNDTLLQLYGLYKQGTEGNADAAPHARFGDFIGTAKLSAWRALAGMPREQARRRYIDLVRDLAAGR